jgi:hypothetical protein
MFACCGQQHMVHGSDVADGRGVQSSTLKTKMRQCEQSCHFVAGYFKPDFSFSSKR